MNICRQEVQHMCKAVEAFAKKESIYSAIESYDECDLEEDEIIKRIMRRFNIDRELAQKYFDDVFVTE